MEKNDKRTSNPRIKKEENRMGVAKGVMGVVPKEHTEKFLACFKKTRTNKEEVKETKAVHKFKIEK